MGYIISALPGQTGQPSPYNYRVNFTGRPAFASGADGQAFREGYKHPTSNAYKLEGKFKGPDGKLFDLDQIYVDKSGLLYRDEGPKGLVALDAASTTDADARHLYHTVYGDAVDRYYEKTTDAPAATTPTAGAAAPHKQYDNGFSLHKRAEGGFTLKGWFGELPLPKLTDADTNKIDALAEKLGKLGIPNTIAEAFPVIEVLKEIKACGDGTAPATGSPATAPAASTKMLSLPLDKTAKVDYNKLTDAVKGANSNYDGRDGRLRMSQICSTLVALGEQQADTPVAKVLTGLKLASESKGGLNISDRALRKVAAAAGEAKDQYQIKNSRIAPQDIIPGAYGNQFVGAQGERYKVNVEAGKTYTLLEDTKNRSWETGKEAELQVNATYGVSKNPDVKTPIIKELSISHQGYQIGYDDQGKLTILDPQGKVCDTRPSFIEVPEGKESADKKTVEAFRLLSQDYSSYIERTQDKGIEMSTQTSRVALERASAQGLLGDTVKLPPAAPAGQPMYTGRADQYALDRPVGLYETKADAKGVQDKFGEQKYDDLGPKPSKESVPEQPTSTPAGPATDLGGSL